MPPETRDQREPEQPAATGWLAAHRLLALGLAVGGMLLVGAIGTVVVVLATRQPQEKPVTLAETLAALDANDYIQARQLAEKMQRQGTLSMEDWGGPVFVLGVVADHEAETAPSATRSRAISWPPAGWKTRRAAASRPAANRKGSACWASAWR